jgi:hypothetical protein
MNSTTWFGSIITPEPRGLTIEEDLVIDADPDVIDEFE